MAFINRGTEEKYIKTGSFTYPGSTMTLETGIRPHSVRRIQIYVPSTIVNPHMMYVRVLLDTDEIAKWNPAIDKECIITQHKQQIISGSEIDSGTVGSVPQLVFTIETGSNVSRNMSYNIYYS